MRYGTLAVLLLCLSQNLAWAENYKVSTSAQGVICSSVYTVFGDAEVCYMYDLKSKKRWNESTVSEGLGINFGTALLGGSGQIMVQTKEKADLGSGKVFEQESEFVICGGQSTIATDKRLCYIYDLKKKKHWIEVRIGGGFNLNTGSPEAGGRSQALVRTTIRFPLGTSKEEIFKEAKEEFKALQAPYATSPLVQNILKSADLEFLIIKESVNFVYLEPKDPKGKRFDKEFDNLKAK